MRAPSFDCGGAEGGLIMQLEDESFVARNRGNPGERGQKGAAESEIEIRK